MTLLSSVSPAMFPGMSPGNFPAKRQLILGSTSAYRRELLSRLRYPFDIESPGVDETALPGETPPALATRLAFAKASAVAEKFPDAIVIGSDQVADLHGKALGKPGVHENAVAQLREMRGQTVICHTAVCVICKNSNFKYESTAAVEVEFRDLSDDEIEAYLRAEQPYDCAGSAKSEGLGITLLSAVRSDDPTALVGLPLIRVASALREAGVDLVGSIR